MKYNLTYILILFYLFFHQNNLFSRDFKNVTLEKYLKLILQNNPEIKEAKEGIKEKASFLTQAKKSRYPKISITGFAAPSPAIKGNIQDSKINWNKWGPFFRTEIEAKMPLYTFGQITHGKNAAINAINVEKAMVKEVKSKVIFRSKQIFYGYLLAYSIYHNVIKFTETHINKAITYAEEQYDLATGKVSKADLGRLKIGKAELLNKKAETEKFLALTKSALNTFLEHQNIKAIQIKKEEIKIEKANIKNLKEYVNTGFKKNPKWLQLQHGIKAREQLIKFEKSKNHPILFLAGRFSASWAPYISKVTSLFANNYYNELTGGIAIGIKWDLDFTQSGPIEKAKAEYRKLIEKSRFAKKGIYMLIKQAYLEIQETKKKININNKAYRTALSWMTFSILAFESGTGPAKDALEGLVAVSSYQFNYYKSIFNYNMALAKMSQLLEKEISNLKY